MLLPVVVRELQVRSRASGPHYVRMAAVAALALVWATMFQTFGRGGASGASGRIGLEVLSSLLLMYALVEGVRTSAGGISEERREGTLGLLFLTDLSGLDVLLGKMSGAAIQGFCSLVAVVPVLAVAVLFGGVSGSELVRMVVALSAVLALSLACGSWSSTRPWDGMVAMLAAMGVLLLHCLLPLLLDLLLSLGGVITVFPRFSVLGLASPLCSVALIPDPPAGGGTSRFWISSALLFGQALLWILLAGWRLQKGWRHAGLDLTGGEGGGGVVRTAPSTKSADALGWAVSRHLNLPRWSRLLVLITFVHAAGTAGMNFAATWLPSYGPLMQRPLGMISLTRMFLIIWQATRALGDWHRGGELEILLTTTAGERDLVLQVWNQFRSVLVRVILVDVLTSGLLTGAMVALTNSISPAPILPNWFLVFHWASQELVEIAQFLAMVWVGFWMGLCSRKTGSAVGKTFGVVVVSSFALTMLVQIAMSHWMEQTQWMGQWGFVIPLMSFTASECGLSLVWVRWARHRLFVRLRPVACGTGT